MISKGRGSEEPYPNLKVTEANIAAHYFGVKVVPCKVRSPLREDSHPSFGFYSVDGKSINFRDFASGEHGSIWTLLTMMWGCTYRDAKNRVFNEMDGSSSSKVSIQKTDFHGNQIRVRKLKPQLEVTVREWREYDIEYWKSYGIPISWLQYADVYPISYKHISKDGMPKITYRADKYAYVYVEFKEGKTSYKIYQPFNKDGFKWTTSHDSSVISLWSKLPETGDKVVICSSTKDALCLMANTGYRTIAPQGEGMKISDTAANELKRRFKQVFILYDNDETGLKDSKKLADKHGFTNLVLPNFEGGKDISDLYKVKGKEEFLQIILSLFKTN